MLNAEIQTLTAFSRSAFAIHTGASSVRQDAYVWTGSLLV